MKALVAALALALAAPSSAAVVTPDRLEDAAAGDFAAMGEFAWRAFVALNWPGAGGAPDRGKALGDPGSRVWETFAGPNPCGGGAHAPFAEFNQPGFAVDAPANPLVAQNGEYVRYEVRFNAVEYAAFVENGWTQGRNLPDAGHPARFPVGSVAIKAAWRPLNADDPPAVRARYYVTRAAIVDVAGSLAAGRPVCSQRELALVGLHIVIKTKTRPQWIWASFEHVDNVPPSGAGEPDAAQAHAPYGFFDARRPAKLWPPFGAAGTDPIDASNPPRQDPAPMQIVRRHPVNAELMAKNRDYWAQPGVRGTVFEHYMLVAAQWPTSADPPGPDNDGAYFPGQAGPLRDESYKAEAPAQENLVNATMESYHQEAPSSCMACHQAAANHGGFDFVGALAHLAAP